MRAGTLDSANRPCQRVRTLSSTDKHVRQVPLVSAQELTAPPRYVAVDTVVDKIGSNLWDYHWCLKSINPVEPFYVKWDEVNFKGFTLCDGWIGSKLHFSYGPSDLHPTTIIVGSNMAEIHPNIKWFPQSDQAKPIWDRFLEFLTTFFGSLPADKAATGFVSVGLTIRSTATPVLVDGRQILTKYKIEYLSHTENDTSDFKISFDPDLTERVTDLEGLIDFSDKPVEFTAPGAPANVISSIVFVDQDGYQVGSMPVSLAVPSE